MKAVNFLWMHVLLVVPAAACGGSDDTTAVVPPRLHAAPFTADLVATRGERRFEYFERQSVLVNKWIAQTGIPKSSTGGITQIVAQSRDQKGKLRSMNASDVVVNLETWLNNTQAKDSAAQAGGYLVADRILRLAWRPFLLSDSNQWQEWRDTLKVLGAETFFSEAAHEIEYTGSWLHVAVDLNARGPMGQRAALLLAETDCGDTPQTYHPIIARLDSVLTNAADSEVRFTAALLEADAYRDIVALAHGFGGANADTTKFLPEADLAKATALRLYHTALAIDSTSRLARGGRLDRDRLASGQPLDHARFFCFAE